MRLFRSIRPTQTRRRFVPCFEALEARDCPSAAPGVSAVVSGHTLMIHGDANANTVAITDDGHGNVTGTIDGKSATGAGINKILVDTRDGNDTVNYTLNSALTVSEAIFIEMGKGTGTAPLDFTAGVASGNLKLSAEGHGADTMAASFGSIAAGASVNASLEGGKGDDNLSVNFAGQLNGTFRFAAEGSQGNDTITANVIINTGSTGNLNAKVEGGAGTDNLTFNVTDNTADPTTGKTVSVSVWK